MHTFIHACIRALHVYIHTYVCLYVCTCILHTYEHTHIHYTITLQVLIDQTMLEYDLIEEYFYPLSDEDFDNRLVYTCIHIYISTYCIVHININNTRFI